MGNPPFLFLDYMRRRCALLGIRDLALQCKLFDTLVLPILSYGCEVWGVDAKCGAAAEAQHEGFMKSLMGDTVRKSVATHMVLAGSLSIANSLLAAGLAVSS